ncbi:MAG: methyltransferase domain-containing protein, partial [Acidimicrobiales bacterium]
MPERYRFEFKAGSTYERVVWLLQRCGPPGGVVVDLGCGYGPLAEPVRDLGFTYAGLDADPEAVADLAGRGFEAGKVALDAGADMAALVGRVTAGRPLAALCLLDVLEHLADGAATLASMRDAVAGHPGAVMLLSVPNVTHVDLAAKLLIGRWDVTPTGLLDETHISLYSESRLKALLGQVGWEEISTEDLIFPRSDQHFPPEAAALDPGSPLGALVHQVRGRLPGATVNQFIGAYRPGPPAPAPAPALLDRFLTVVVRTQGRRRQLLPETLLSLVAQTSQDFDVVLCCHDTDPAARGQVEAAVAALPPDFASRVELVEVTGGGRGRPLNVAFARGRGRYLAVLDDDDVAFAHWVESFANAGAATPGRLLRAVVAGQAVEPTAGPPPAPAGPPPNT